MKGAIITIDFRHYLVADPKKALAVVQILNAAQRVEASGYNEFAMRAEPIDAAMETLANKVVIKPLKKKGVVKA